MKHLPLSVAALVLACLPMSASSQSPASTGGTPVTNAPPPADAPLTVRPNRQGEQNGITVTNGNFQGQFPQYGESTGEVTLKKNSGANANKSRVTLAYGFKGSIAGIENGDRVEVGSAGNPMNITGTGGEVHIPQGSTAMGTVQNTGTAGPGATSIRIFIGSTTQYTEVLPGMTVPFGHI